MAKLAIVLVIHVKHLPQIKRPNVRAKQYEKFFYFVDLKEGQPCFPCILIKGKVDQNGTDQCVNGTNLFKFGGFSTPDLFITFGQTEAEKEEKKEQK